MVFAGGLAIYADARRVEADRQRRIAERESATARATSDFLIASFALANPATDNPRTITALTILKLGAARARIELAGQPVVQARLIATLAQAYNNLGLYPEARDAVERSMPAILKAGPEGATAQLALADSYFLLGLFDRALATTRRAEATLGSDPRLSIDQRAKAAVIEGQIWTNEGDTARGLSAFDRALALYRSAPKRDDRRIAVALQNRGLLLNDDGDLSAAHASFAEALAINRRVLGEQHLDTGQSWYARWRSMIFPPAAFRKRARRSTTRLPSSAGCWTPTTTSSPVPSNSRVVSSKRSTDCRRRSARWNSRPRSIANGSANPTT